MKINNKAWWVIGVVVFLILLNNGGNETQAVDDPQVCYDFNGGNSQYGDFVEFLEPGTIAQCETIGCITVLEQDNIAPLPNLYSCQVCGEPGDRVKAPSKCCSKQADEYPNFGNDYDYRCIKKVGVGEGLINFFADLNIPIPLLIGGAIIVLIILVM